MEPACFEQDEALLERLVRRATATLPAAGPTSTRRAAAESEAPRAERLCAADLVPQHLLDGGEIVLFAIKPSLWYILFASLRWVLIFACVVALSPWLASVIPGAERPVIVKAALALAAARLGFAVMDWVARLYILTNRRVMRIRGIFNVQIFECSLLRIQNTGVTLSWYERLLGLGSIHFATAGTSGYEASWVNVPHPLEVHEQVRAAITRARGLGGNAGV